ncbi:hypothetical protein QJS66_17700 [Kocuria rhizophila]|nr:hypothetical protein QJS66_17700 [Kocuria rhizophila]
MYNQLGQDSSQPPRDPEKLAELGPRPAADDAHHLPARGRRADRPRGGPVPAVVDPRGQQCLRRHRR